MVGNLAPVAVAFGGLFLSAINLLAWAAMVWAADKAAAGCPVAAGDALRRSVRLPWGRFIGTVVLAMLLLGGLLMAPAVLLNLLR